MIGEDKGGKMKKKKKRKMEGDEGKKTIQIKTRGEH